MDQPVLPVPLSLLEESLRLAAAIVAGGALGLNRNLRGKAAGLRTHALVALGAALVVLTTEQIGDRELSRVVQGVITGIGFIGAGVILHPRHTTERVRGLTTAASVWVAAALGVAAGAGMWSVVALGTLGTLGVLLGGGQVEDAVRRRFLRLRRETRLSRETTGEAPEEAPARPPASRNEPRDPPPPPAPPSPPPPPPSA